MRIIAIISAHNEGDIIYHVIGDLIANNVLVYLIDNQSIDNTIAEASRWLGKGLLHVERFPDDMGLPLEYKGEYRWREILLRKEQLAAQLGADWYIHADADEFRESPWDGLTLHDAIRRVDEAGYNAIDFELYNFRPTDNSFIAGADVRKFLTHYEPGEDFNSLQIKAWKNTGVPVDIATYGGHNITFLNRKIYPHRFILRHYPIRSQLHGIRKVFEERKKRFTREEIEGGWHLQYNAVTSQSHDFLYAQEKLTLYDPILVRNELFSRPIEVAVFCLECPEQAYSRIRFANIQKHFPDRIKYSFGVRTESNGKGYLFDLALSRIADIIIISRLFPSSQTSAIINDFLNFGKPVVYDADELFTDIPDHNPFKQLVDECKPYIENLMRRADMVTVATEKLKEQLASYNSNIQVLPNYLDDQLWLPTSKPKKHHDSLVIGYAGWFTNKPDLEVIEEALIKLSHKYGDRVTFCFMGCVTDRIKSLQNFHYIDGEIDYAEYASALSHSGFDIALAPRADNGFNRCKSNIKWLEYSACGFAGIYSNIPPYNNYVENMKTGLLVENSAEKWFEAIDMLASNPDLRIKIGENARSKVLSDHALAVNAHTYIQTYRTLLYGNETTTPNQTVVTRPAASIVIVTYNSMTTLAACIESVARSLSPGDDVVLVDNASRDETVAMTEQLTNGLPAFRIIKNETNAGFSAATNQGILATNNPLVVLLNPDTVVPKNWLNGLSRHLSDSVAAVGPVSNYVAGLQKMELYQMAPLPSSVAIDDVAELFQKWNDGKGVETRLLIGFCMMIQREALAKIGYLDRELFLGNDDLDVSWRLRLNGYQLEVAPDVFVYHAGQVSFSSEPNETTKQLVQESTDHLYRKLLAHYTPSPVPSPMDLWGIGWFAPSAGVLAAVESDRLTKAEVSNRPVSIVILTWNQLPFTQACLESIRRYTPEPYQLIVVDNCSNDGTIPWLREQARTDNRILVIENSENRGFAAGCNQGINVAQGEFILLLNNDTVVTPGWLPGMRELLDRYPDAGIVGPMTNSASGVQVVANPGYKTLDELPLWSAAFRENNRYRIIRQRRIVGFCMLFRRELVEKIGLLDESFGSGNFEDDDFCLRSELAGYHNMIAGDVFVYHAGGATFVGNRINFAEAMMHNMTLYRAKWNYNRLDETTLRRLVLLDTIQEARRLSMRDETDASIELLIQKGIRVAPDQSAPYIELTEILMAAERYNEALQVVPEMPATTDRMLIHEIEAICHAAQSYDEAALISANQALERPRALVVLGTLAARSGYQAEAEAFFSRAIDVDPSCGSAWLSLGMLQWSRGRQDDAWRALKRSVMVDPLNNEAVKILRDLAERVGRVSEVGTLVDAATHMYPDSRSLALHHAALLAQCDQPADALEACESFLVNFGVDDTLLPMALDLRNHIGMYDRLAEGGTGSVTLCMIVKDEMKNLAHCLASAKSLVHEIVVVDTGSTDHTADIAAVFGARVFNYPWQGNFSDARNCAINEARGKWILVMDADEVLSVKDHEFVRSAVREADGNNQAWSVLTRNYTSRVNAHGWTRNDHAYPAEERSDGWHPSWKVRLFPNDQRIRFIGEVHEMVEHSLERAGFSIKQASFVIHHYGGLNEVINRDKMLHYFDLGRQKLQERPDDSIALLELATQAGELELHDEALKLWDRLLLISPNCVEALFNKGYNLIKMRRYEEALVVSKKVLDLDSFHKEAAFNYGTCELYAGEPAAAVQIIEPISKDNPDYPPLLAVLTLLYLLSDEREKAASTLRMLLTLNYAIVDYARDRAMILRTLGKETLAQKLLDECSAIGMGIDVSH